MENDAEGSWIKYSTYFVGVKNYQEFCIHFWMLPVFFSIFLFSDNKELFNVQFCNYKHILVLFKVLCVWTLVLWGNLVWMIICINKYVVCKFNLSWYRHFLDYFLYVVYQITIWLQSFCLLETSAKKTTNANKKICFLCWRIFFGKLKQKIKKKKKFIINTGKN